MGEGVNVVVRDAPGPDDGPALALLHGVALSSDVNWQHAFDPLSGHFRVVAVDQRGHGRGLPATSSLSLEQAADDVADVMVALAVKPAVIVGYSMGGMVAQLLWRQHPNLVSGLVLCSTAPDFVTTPIERLFLWTANSLTGIKAFDPLLRSHIEHFGQSFIGPLPEGDVGVSLAGALKQADPSAICRTALAVASFRSFPWLEEIDVPTAVVVTTDDRVVPAVRQLELANRITGAELYEVNGDHGACLTDPDAYVPVLVEACRRVAARAEGAIARHRRVD